ncbi:MAG: DNA polymerase IV [Calditrichia bacterium]
MNNPAVWPRMIVHMDMDAFFASVEQLLHPEWKGKPVIVGADPREGKGRGVVAAASYEARVFGVHSAMPISKAYRLCPHGVYVRHHSTAYGDYSRKIFAILESFSPLVQPLSIDEAFLDMTGAQHLYKGAADIGEQIRKAILGDTGLTASVGIAPSKSVAKIASDFNKPDGLTIVPATDVQHFLDRLPVSRLWGIGPKMLEQLRKLGIANVAQLRAYPLDFLEQRFGKMGEHVYRMARGDDQREVSTTDEVKSVSNEMTFELDQRDWQVVQDVVFRLSEKVCGRLRRAGIRGRTVTLKIRFEDFRTCTRSRSVKNPTHLTAEVYDTAAFLLEEFNPLPRPVRLLGVGVSNLVTGKGLQLNFLEEDNRRKLQLEKVMDQLQDKFGKNIIVHARSLRSGSHGKPEGE